MDGFIWHDPPDEVFPAGMDEYLAAIKQGIMAIAVRRAPEIEAWLKTNASWVDRSGNARQTLHTEVRVMAEQVVIVLSHGMDYGKWLELANGGRYAIVGPGLDHWAPIIWNDVEALLR